MVKAHFVPFRERRHPVWPNGARLAFAMYLAPEEWDPETMGRYTRLPLLPYRLPDSSQADLSMTTTVEYGFRVGVYRLIEIFDHFNIRPSLLSNALAIERHPELFRELIAKGYRLVGHGYEQGKYMAQMSREEAADVIRKCVEIPMRILGVRPNGWGSPATRQTEETLELLAQAGFSFHMGLHDDELPYFLELKTGHRLVEIPYRIADSGELNDFCMFPSDRPLIFPEAMEYVRAFVEARYEAAREKPALITFGCHPFVSGRPDRTKVVEHLLRYVSGFPDIWITDFEGMAQWWAANQPVPAQSG